MAYLFTAENAEQKILSQKKRRGEGEGLMGEKSRLTATTHYKSGFSIIHSPFRTEACTSTAFNANKRALINSAGLARRPLPSP
jgi:hypothetical protein